MNSPSRKLYLTLLGVVMLGCLGVAVFLYWGWVSPLEKSAMAQALDKMDDLGIYEGPEDATYQQKLQMARNALALCYKRRITAYDRQLFPLLAMQLDGAITKQRARTKASKDPQYKQWFVTVEECNRNSEKLIRENLSKLN